MVRIKLLYLFKYIAGNVAAKVVIANTLKQSSGCFEVWEKIVNQAVLLLSKQNGSS